MPNKIVPHIVQESARRILRNLEQVREDLLSLSDDIWLNTDHNNNEILPEAVKFKIKYNDKVAAFDNLSEELAELIRKYTHVVTKPEPIDPLDQNPEVLRKIEELDTQVPYTLDEDFTYKRPFGFKLGELAYTGLTTWRSLYELLCVHLAERDPELFRGLPVNEDFISKRGNRVFSTDKGSLRSASKLSNEIYAEVNLSANHIRNIIRQLLKTFQIEEKEMSIYLREDRDATCDE